MPILVKTHMYEKVQQKENKILPWLIHMLLLKRQMQELSGKCSQLFFHLTARQKGGNSRKNHIRASFKI